MSGAGGVSNPAAPTYPVGVIAKLLLLTERRVQQLTTEGIIPKAERGRYELAPAVQGYIRFLQERHLGQEGDDGADATLAGEKLKKLTAEREMKELELGEMRGQLHREGAIVRTYSARVVAARAKMLSLPKKLAPQLVEMADPVEIETIIKAEIYAALRELAPPTQSNLDATSGIAAKPDAAGTDSERAGPDGQAVPREDRSSVDAAAGLDGQPVG